MNSSSLRIGSFTIEKTLAFQIWISIFHVVGIVGLYLEVSRPLFQLLTPFHLLMCAGILLYFHTDWSRSFWMFLLASFGIGMIAEIVGVQTGLLFGDYSYGPVLGLKLAGVPLIIGINWFILAYASGQLAANWIKSPLIAAAAASLLMVVLDFVIEPVAITLDFWNWQGGEIPLGNYIGWFLVAFLIQLIYQNLPLVRENQISTYLLLNLFLFFAILIFLL
ncbi:carotenoid biosynthesis protein [Lunatimonas lonarensis]|nr:carotenoid biosynthesis protein [Lunatimonas lonarensis]